MLGEQAGGQGGLPGEGVCEKGLKGRGIGFESPGEGAGGRAARTKVWGHEQQIKGLGRGVCCYQPSGA